MHLLQKIAKVKLSWGENRANTNKVLVIAGVTASGKSRLACELFPFCSVKIINADSRQVYKFVPVLTAQPRDSFSQDSYSLYSSVDLESRYSVANWISDVLLHIDQSFNEGKLPVLVGGTGMYISSFIGGISFFPEILPNTQSLVSKKFLDMGREAFYRYYSGLDPSIEKIHLHDTYRLFRAAHFIEQTGKSVNDFYSENPPKRSPYDIELIMIMPDRETNNFAIAERVNHMICDGALDEVQDLLNMGMLEHVATRTIFGVLEFSEYLSGKISLDDAKKKVIQKTTQYAKRQYTWFRNQFKDENQFESIVSAKNYLIPLLKHHF